MTNWEKEFDELRKGLKWSAPEAIEDQYKSFIDRTLAKQRTQLLKEVRHKVILDKVEFTGISDITYENLMRGQLKKLEIIFKEGKE